MNRKHWDHQAQQNKDAVLLYYLCFVPQNNWMSRYLADLKVVIQ